MDDEDSAWSIDELSDGQKIVRIVVEICTASLSIAGSSVIVFKILRDRALYKSMTPYDRIIFGLSSCDIIASIGWAMNEFLMPSEKSLNLWAFGNSATCNAVGFWTQISFSATWYNCLLSYYFLLTVLSQVKRKNLVRKFEPWMHLSATFFPITAVIGLYRGWYGVIITNCVINDPMLHWIFVASPLFFTYISLIINNIVIYAVVRNSLRSSEHAAGFSAVQKRLKRESATLMFLYVGFFFLSNSPTIIMVIWQEYFDYTVGQLYPVLVLDAFLWPLQGFFNFFIYIKPMYTRFRAAYPDKSMFFVLHQALFNPDVPQMNSPSEQSIVPANPNEALFNSNFRPPSASSDSSDSDDSSASSDSS